MDIPKSRNETVVIGLYVHTDNDAHHVCRFTPRQRCQENVSSKANRALSRVQGRVF